MPLVDLFGVFLILCLMFAWFWLTITVIVDVFQSPDLSGGMKALWVLLVLLIPLVVAIIYIIMRGDGMKERAFRKAPANYR